MPELENMLTWLIPVMGFSPEELAEINAYVDTRDSLLTALSFPLEEVPYITCENLYCLKWGLIKFVKELPIWGWYSNEACVFIRKTWLR